MTELIELIQANVGVGALIIILFFASDSRQYFKLDDKERADFSFSFLFLIFGGLSEGAVWFLFVAIAAMIIHFCLGILDFMGRSVQIKSEQSPEKTQFPLKESLSSDPVTKHVSYDREETCAWARRQVQEVNDSISHMPGWNDLVAKLNQVAKKIIPNLFDQLENTEILIGDLSREISSIEKDPVTTYGNTSLNTMRHNRLNLETQRDDLRLQINMCKVFLRRLKSEVNSGITLDLSSQERLRQELDTLQGSVKETTQQIRQANEEIQSLA